MKRRAGSISINDHALLRFIERAGGFDVEGLRAAIETSLSRAALAAQRAGGVDYKIAVDGMIYVVRAGRDGAADEIVTVVKGRLGTFIKPREDG